MTGRAAKCPTLQCSDGSRCDACKSRRKRLKADLQKHPGERIFDCLFICHHILTSSSVAHSTTVTSSGIAAGGGRQGIIEEESNTSNTESTKEREQSTWYLCLTTPPPSFMKRVLARPVFQTNEGACTQRAKASRGTGIWTARVDQVFFYYVIWHFTWVSVGKKNTLHTGVQVKIVYDEKKETLDRICLFGDIYKKTILCIQTLCKPTRCTYIYHFAIISKKECNTKKRKRKRQRKNPIIPVR